MAILIDSDMAAANSTINSTKERLMSEFGKGAFAWLTQGREIENYVPKDVLAMAVQRAHPNVHKTWVEPRNMYAKALGGLKNPDKVKIAEEAVLGEPIWGTLDLETRVEALVAFIRSANG
jgi:hypothetical protein